ncbi:hypothetical protein RND81_11G173800 [Saponaria officinalis]|uniref:RING-type E3 ubiquitin transferase n=1 Tax=Saponaria officinalis TaxID=3572 RepID=A0AAW1HNM5_SAPOF
MQAPTSAPTNPTSVELSPPLIAMLVLAAAAFLLVTYSHFISHRLLPPFRRVLLRYRRPHFPLSVMGSPPPPLFESSDGFFVYSPYGLDDSVINNIPLTIFKPCKLGWFEVDCAVCLINFEDGDYMRTLPHCCHSFHVDCIDVWLRSHATCPLCRSGALFPPMTPLMAARIRPSLEEGITLGDLMMSPQRQRRRAQSEDHQVNRGLLKRSHSFSMAATPRQSMWMKRPSSIAKSWRKSTGGGRRNMGAMSEWSGSIRYMEMSSSRTRTGDPEALISPERVRRHLINY